MTHNVPKTDTCTYVTRPLDVLEHLDLDLAGCAGAVFFFFLALRAVVVVLLLLLPRAKVHSAPTGGSAGVILFAGTKASDREKMHIATKTLGGR